VGQYKNGGREWQRSGQPEQVNVHDFPDPSLGKALPYGMSDLGQDSGWVKVGCDHDTARFAVEKTLSEIRISRYRRRRRLR
jgi:Rhodopirellula transposase DDE domain